MASRWIDVMLLQSEPIDMALDSTTRSRFAFNIRVTRGNDTLFDHEIVTVLTTAGLPSADIFVSSKAQIPAGNGPYLMVTVTGGDPGVRTHNVVTGPTYRHSTAQILAVGLPKPSALALAESAMAALAAVKDTNVT